MRPVAAGSRPGLAQGYGIVVCACDSPQPLAAAASLAELDGNTGDRYWYDTATGLLHLKVTTKTGRTSATLHVEPQ